MDCDIFRRQHVGFVDDTLAAIEMVAMRRHLAECPDCAEHDTRVRRSLLIFRNQPQIAPSPDFRARLEARLREAGPSSASTLVALRDLGGGAEEVSGLRPIARRRLVRRAVPAAGLLAAGLLLSLTLGGPDAPEPLVHEPVVASIPEDEASAPIGPPALMAAVPAGIPVWSAALMAEQAPIHFVGAEFSLTSWGR